MRWKEGKLLDAKITSRNGGVCKVKYGDKMNEITTLTGKTYSF